MNDELLLLSDEISPEIKNDIFWQILVVDDEEMVLQSTKRILEEFVFDNLPIKILTATNLTEAKKTINDDVCVIILDVVMKSERGTDLISFIRNELNNNCCQIMLRTGQAGEETSEQTSIKHDIFCYLDKHDLSPIKLRTFLISAIKAYKKEKHLDTLVQEKLVEINKVHAKLVESEKMAIIGTLSAGIVHEVKNALNAISGGINGLARVLESIEKGNPTDVEKIRKIYKLVNEGRDRAIDIFENLSIASRRESIKKSHKLKEIVDGALYLMKGKTRQYNVKMESNISGDQMIICNQTSLLQALMNFISNAVDAMKDTKNGLIVIDAETTSDKTIIQVSDNGPGVPEKNQKTLFEAFFTTKAVGEGTGLGLYVTKTQIEADGATVQLDPTYKSGARFILKYPLL